MDFMSMPPLPQGLVQLLWFVRVIDAGSFAEAARRAGITTSALSKAVSRFEKSYGVRLLHRSTHYISLTDEGDRLLSEGRSLLERLEETDSLLKDLSSSNAAGRIRLTAPVAFGRACLLPALPRFLSLHPEIQLEIQFGDDIADLAARGVDLAIRFGRPSSWPGLVAKEIHKFSWVICASPDYLKRKGIPNNLEDLASHHLIGFRNKATGQVDNWNLQSPEDAKSIRFIPRATHILDDAESVWMMIRSGTGIGWAPEWLASTELREGRVIEIMKEWRAAPSSIYAVRLQRRHTPKRTQTIASYIASLSKDWRL